MAQHQRAGENKSIPQTVFQWPSARGPDCRRYFSYGRQIYSLDVGIANGRSQLVRVWVQASPFRRNATPNLKNPKTFSTFQQQTRRKKGKNI